MPQSNNSADILIQIRAENTQALKAIQGIDRSMKNMATNATREMTRATRATSGFSKTLGMVAKQIGAFFIIRGVGRLTSSMFEIASSAEEIQTRYQVVMKDMRENTDEFVDSASKNLGLFKSDMQDSLSVIQNITEAMGFVPKEANKFSIAINSLSNDMASFFDIPISESFRALRSGLVGETEPLRRLGILTTENALAQFALDRGITKTTRKMSEQEKMILRLLAITKQSTNAQGDLARTLGSSANVLRILQSSLKTLASVWGKLLIQVVKPFFLMLLLISRALTAIGMKLQAFFGIANDVKDLGDSVKSVSAIADAQDDLAKATDKANKAMGKNLQAFDELNQMSKPKTDKDKDGESKTGVGEEFQNILDNIDFANFLEGAEGAIDKLLEPIVSKLKEFRENMKPFTDLFIPLREGAEKSIKPIEDIIASLVEIAESPVLKFFLDLALAVVGFGLEVAGLVIPLYFETLSTTLGVLVDLLNGDVAGAWNRITRLTKIYGNTLSQLGDAIVDLTVNIFVAFIDILIETQNKLRELSGISYGLAIILVGAVGGAMAFLTTRAIANLLIALISLGVNGYDSLIRKMGRWHLAMMINHGGLGKFTKAIFTAKLSMLGMIGVIAGLVTAFFFLFQTSSKFREGYAKIMFLLATLTVSWGAQVKKVVDWIVGFFLFTIPKALLKLQLSFKIVFLTIKDIMRSIFNSIIDIIENNINKALDMINKVIEAYNKVQSFLGGKTIQTLRVDLSNVKIASTLSKDIANAMIPIGNQLKALDLAKASFDATNSTQIAKMLNSIPTIEQMDKESKIVGEFGALDLEGLKASILGAEDLGVDTTPPEVLLAPKTPFDFGTGLKLDDESISKLASAIGTGQNGVQQTLGDLKLEVDGSEFARLALPDLDEERRNSGTDLVTRGSN